MQKRKRVTNYSRYGRPLLKTGVRLAKAYYRSRTQTRNKKRSTETAPLTYDNDFKTDYRYKSMPRRRRRRWRKFVKRVNAVVNKGQGLKKLLYSDIVRITAPINQCTYHSGMLYTPDARVTDLSADLGTIFRNILGATPYNDINLITIPADVDKKIRFESANMDVSWRNMGTNPVIIDLYYVKCRKTFGLLDVDVSNNTQGIFAHGFVKQGFIIDEEDGTSITPKSFPTEIGTTPFQSSLFCSTFKIMSKKRITIAPGNTVAMTLKDARNRIVNAMDTRARICMRGLTHGYFFQVYGVPGLDGSTPVVSTASDIIFSIQKRYAFYLPVSGKDQASTLAL